MHLFQGHLLEFMVGPSTYSALNNSHPVKEAQVGGKSKIEYSFDKTEVLFIVPEVDPQIEAKSDIWIYTQTCSSSHQQQQ